MRPADITGYLLTDAHDRTVGTITGFWLDDHDPTRPAFASVRTGILRGRERVVPLRHASLDEGRRIVRVAYDAERIRDAPSFAPGARLDPADERAILAHYERAPEGVTAGAPRPAHDIALHEERVDVGKRVVRAGAVRLRKVVRTRIVHQPVEVRYEEIVVERIPYGDVPPGVAEGGALPEAPFTEGEIVLREYAEEPVVEKHTELVGGVRARTHVETQREEIETTLRREDVEVDRLGGR